MSDQWICAKCKTVHPYEDFASHLTQCQGLHTFTHTVPSYQEDKLDRIIELLEKLYDKVYDINERGRP